MKTFRIGRSFLCIRASKFWNRFSMRNRGKKDNGKKLMKGILFSMITGLITGDWNRFLPRMEILI